MGRGRKKLPHKLKVLRGTPSVPTESVATGVSLPDPPSWLDPEARDEWHRVLPLLSAAGQAAALDYVSLACYCQAWSEFRAATEQIQKEGRTFTRGTGGIATHPAVEQQRSAMVQLRHFSQLFGFDPFTRSRLGMVGTEGQKADDAFDAWQTGVG